MISINKVAWYDARRDRCWAFFKWQDTVLALYMPGDATAWCIVRWTRTGERLQVDVKIQQNVHWSNANNALCRWLIVGRKPVPSEKIDTNIVKYSFSFLLLIIYYLL